MAYNEQDFKLRGFENLILIFPQAQQLAIWRAMCGAYLAGTSTGGEMRKSVVKKAATLREQVFQVIVNELKGGQFSPGERITEEGLANRLGVSRTPIREA